MRRGFSYLLVTGICLWLMLGCGVLGPTTPTADAQDPETEQTPAAEDTSAPLDLTPVLLAALAGVLFVATGVGVYLLIRRTPQRRSALDERPVSDEHALPEGTLLDDGHFLVLERVSPTASAEDDLTLYEVKATKPLPLCPRCLSPRTVEGARRCAACDAEVPEDRPQHPVLLAKETDDGTRFASTSRLLAMELGHRAVVLPVTTFAETAFGVTRFFQIEPILRSEPGEGGASGLPVRRDPGVVLAWGVDLMEGLAYLHERAVVFDSVAPRDVFLDDGGAHLVCFEDLVILTDGVTGRSLDPADPEFLAKRRSNLDDIEGLLRRMLRDEEDELPNSDLAAAAETAIARSFTPSGDGEAPLEAGEIASRLRDARRALLRGLSATYDIGVLTDVGRHRTVNEDSVFAMDYSGIFRAHGTVAAVGVADGVGGQAAGDVASSRAVEAIAEIGDQLGDLARAEKLPDADAWVVAAAERANQVVYAERESAGNDMACTLVLALVVGRAVTILNVGDSRAYRLKGDKIAQVTVDHSLVERLVAIGQLTREEARHHPQKSVIYRVVGDELSLQYDLFEIALSRGEALLLCSDGLTDMVEDSLISETWQQAPSAQAACDRLVELANEAGGYDNISVVILSIQDRQ